MSEDPQAARKVVVPRPEFPEPKYEKIRTEGLNDPIEAIPRMHKALSLLYLQESVRVTFKTDVALTVGDVSVIAKEGESQNIPRWVVEILNQSRAVEIHHAVDHKDEISRALNRERIAKPHELSTLAPDFFIKAKAYTTTTPRKERESLAVNLNLFVASRIQKIVRIAASHEDLTPDIASKLSAEERAFFEVVAKAAGTLKKTVSMPMDEDS